MDNFPKIDGELLSQKVKKILLKMMKDGAFNDTGKLPSEEKLARTLGVSRSVIRDVLILFETEGFITRRRGIGTVINEHVLNVASRLDLEKEFLELIAEGGYTPKIFYVHIFHEQAGEEACKKLQLEKGEEIFVVERLITADNIPAIHCVDHFSKNLIVDHNYDEEELKEPIFNFLSNRCNVEIFYNLTEVVPLCVEQGMAEIMSITPGEPILYFDEVGYDIEQKPVLWSKEHHRDGLLRYSFLRKKI